MHNIALFIVLLLGLSSWSFARPVAPQVMRAYSIDLPHHILRFSVPEEIARQMTPRQVESSFSPDDPVFLKHGFRSIAGKLYDFKGPFWKDAYGSLEFDFMVVKKSRSYAPSIASLTGLEEFLIWREKNRVERIYNFKFARDKLGSMPCVLVRENRFENPELAEPRDHRIYAVPLDEEIFFQAVFFVMQWKDGRGKEAKWKPQAEAFLEAIKASIVLEPKR